MDGNSVSAPAPTLMVRIGSEHHVLSPVDGPAVLGRDPGAEIRIDDERISRRHLILEPQPGGWQIIDTSSNGLFVDGARVQSLLIVGPRTVELSDAEGIPVSFIPGEVMESTQISTPGDGLRELIEEYRSGEQAVPQPAAEPAPFDPGPAPSGVDPQPPAPAGFDAPPPVFDHPADAPVPPAFEPPPAPVFEPPVQTPPPAFEPPAGAGGEAVEAFTTVEELLRWRPGTLAHLQHGMPAQEPSRAAAPLALAVGIVLHAINSAVGSLPTPAEADFIPRINTMLGDLRKLETLVGDAALHAPDGRPLILTLSAIRRCHLDLALQALRSPAVTLGQRLRVARRRAELTPQEIATAAGLPVQQVLALEDEQPVDGETAEAVESLIAVLSDS